MNKVMKANKALEKIYVADATFPDYVDFDGSPINTKRIDDNDIEYIRTDIFIENVCEFIKERFSFEDSWHVEGETTILDKVIEDIKKYMEGE